MKPPMIPPNAGQIDYDDPRIKSIICLVCKRLLWVERGSRLDKECLCQQCSVQSDIIAEAFGVQ